MHTVLFLVGDGEMGFEEFVRLLSSEPTDAQQETSATREAFEVFDAVSPYTHCDISEWLYWYSRINRTV